MATDHGYRFVRVLIDRGEQEDERLPMLTVLSRVQGALPECDVVYADDQNGFDWKRANVPRIR